MKKITMAALTVGLMAVEVYATCSSTDCTGLVTRLYVNADGTIYVGTDGDEKALNCAGGTGNGGVSGVYMSLKEGDVGKNAMYSLLLTAQATKKPVTIRIQEGSSDCRVLYVTTK